MRVRIHSSTHDQLRIFREQHQYTYRMIDGVGWEYVRAGKGARALLLLPGGPGRGETSFQYILAFESDYRVIAPSFPARIGTVDALVDGLMALLRAEGIERTHVLGGSYSGMIAQCLLRRHPHLVDRLVLSDTGIPNVRRARRTRLLLGCIEVLPFGVVRALLKLGTYAFVHPMGTDREFWRHYFHVLLDGLGRDDLRARLEVAIDIDANKRFTPWVPSNWDGAILVLDAHNDALFGAEQAQLRAMYPEATTQTICDNGHAGSLADAHMYIAAIGRFLEAKVLTRL